MTSITSSALAAALLAAIAACQPAGEAARDPADISGEGDAPAGAPAPIASAPSDNPRFSAILPDETIRLVGTEPFWGGTIEAGKLVYTTMDNERGESIAVSRFAGNGGLGFSGTWQGKPLDLTITAGTCSDGMSDRSFPFTATLKLGEEQRNGCAWTNRSPFTGPAAP